MDESTMLAILKTDLELLGSTKDSYLNHLLKVAEEEIRKEGIQLTKSAGDGNLQITYAAYLYRKRASENTAMPRHLRWALNQRLFGKKEDANVT